MNHLVLNPEQEITITSKWC